jgi:hypothetical protein
LDPGLFRGAEFRTDLDGIAVVVQCGHPHCKRRNANEVRRHGV